MSETNATTPVAPISIPSQNASTYIQSGISLSAIFGSGDIVSPPHLLQVDTGSSGIVIPRSIFGGKGHDDLKKVYPCFGPYTMNYFPSTNSRSGIWYYMPLTLAGTDSTGTAVTVTCQAMVLVCDDTPATVGMMGVSAKGENPAYNAFLQATAAYASSTASTVLAPGYGLTTSAVMLGMAHSASDGYVGASLISTRGAALPTQTNPDKATYKQWSYNGAPLSAWSVPPATLKIEPPGVPVTNQNALYTLSFELDTGINQALICMPMGASYAGNVVVAGGSYLPSAALGQYDAQANQWYFANDTKLSVQFPPGGAALSYDWKVINQPGTAAPPATNPPSAGPYGSTIYMGPPDMSGASASTQITTGGAATALGFPRINVGRMPLTVANYLYDANAGFIGFKKI